MTTTLAITFSIIFWVIFSSISLLDDKKDFIDTIKRNKELKKEWETKTGVYSYLKK